MNRHATLDTACTGTQAAATYARKSTPDEQGVADQHALNAARAQRDGYPVPDTREYRYGDDDTSGVTTSRKDWDRLVALIESGEAPFCRLYVKDRTRLGRWSDPRQHTYWEVHFERHGVQIVYSERERQIDYRDPASRGEMIGHFIKDQVDNVVSAEERIRLIRRITVGMRSAVLRGFYPGSTAPYATERWLADARSGTLVERVPEGKRLRREGCDFRLRWAEDGTTDVVRQIFTCIEAGESLQAIAVRLNEQRTPTPGRSQSWSAEAVRRIARNPIYMGDLVWGRGTRAGDPVTHTEAVVDGQEAILYQDFLPDAPVPRAQWEHVQQLLNGTREQWTQRRATSPDFLLSGLLRCPQCGRAWHGHTSSRKNGTARRRYYRHELSRRHNAHVRCGLNNRYLRAEVVEAAVLAAVQRTLSDERLVQIVEEAIAERQRLLGSIDHAREIARTEQQLRRKEAALDQATMARLEAQTGAEIESCRRVVEALGQEVDHLRSRLADRMQEQNRLTSLERRIEMLPERARDLWSAFADAPLPDQKEILATLIDGIDVGEDLESAVVRMRAL